MKVRIGFGLGTRTNLHDERFGHVVDELERLSFDSLWVSERIGAAAPDPLVAMAYGAGRTTRLKFGMSVMVLPGRNPIVLAKALASLSTMSAGRLLPAFGLGQVHPVEQQAFGVERTERAAWFDESLAVMRQCWTGEPVVHHGRRYDYDGVTVRPVPARMDVWLGGYAPSELKRVGRLADGWLPSFVTPADAAAGRTVIEQVCEEHGREIEADHYGVLIPYSLTGVPDPLLAQLAKRRPDLDPAALVPTSWEALRRLIADFVEVGTTKFVVLPIDEPGTTAAWTAHLEEAARALLPLET
ncbi:MAG: TIGR03854 family LLM class F420-dependent oxidoreductase [Ilumatobacter sp.]|uniref:TIGR03854 family LLM class F420-dependent oxidoreductase n=1 Tax=Ilumatobacter sp. TaxID=1967498 RepID=UPI002612345D|nr:TIGR03854 family LLM class F420-dependent oxidoreductase [Ilumatobacter sp.]MDJ0770796.1 TIGR03854 family LLM class F420-dependent oxidoreductase [Ilumatobacter sp.]